MVSDALASGRDGQVHVLGAGLGDLGEHLLGGRVDRLEPRAGLRVDELAPDEQAVPVLELDDLGRFGRVRVLPDGLALLERGGGLLLDASRASPCQSIVK